MTNFINQLNQFESFGLKELESKNLLNRFDTKFILDIDKLAILLNKLQYNYSILEINGVRNFNYYNIYFDTNEYFFYNQHHNGKVHRSKVRYRHYKDVDKCYFEIKTKTSPSYTVKNRLKEKNIEKKILNSAAELLQDTLSIQPETLKPKLIDTYNRITLLSKESNEKITIDSRLFFQNTINSFEINNIVFIEIKQKRSSRITPAFMALRELNIKESDKISKYCLGLVLTNSVEKYNMFKPTVLKLQKLMKEKNGL